MKREISWLKATGVLANLLPSVSGLFYIGLFVTNLPRPDDWMFVAILEKQSRGVLEFRDVWEPYFSHRLFFPQLFMLALAPFTKWSLRAETFINYGLMVSIAALLWGIFRRGRSRETLTKDLWAFLPINLILFGMKQWENFIWSWQLQTWMSLFGTVATIYLLSLRSKWAFYGGIASGVLASFSFASGLLVWPLGSLVLSLHKRERVQQLLWLACAIMAIIFYTTGLVLPRMEAGIHVGNLLYGFLALIGAALPLSGRVASAYPLWGLASVQNSPSVTADMRVAGAIGTLVLVCVAITVIVISRRKAREPNPWLFFLLFGLGVSFMIAAGRLQEEPANALLSRYATLAGYVVVGAYGLAITTWRETHFKKIIPVLASLVLLIVMSFLISFASEWGRYAPLRWAMDQQMIHALTQRLSGVEVSDPNLRRTIERHEWAERYATVLEKLGYAFFAERR